jgi:hypothetical protein
LYHTSVHRAALQSSFSWLSSAGVSRLWEENSTLLQEIIYFMCNIYDLLSYHCLTIYTIEDHLIVGETYAWIDLVWFAWLGCYTLSNLFVWHARESDLVLAGFLLNHFL